MADIKVTGFINEIKQVGTGTVVELAEKHRRKNEATGEWENDGTATYFDIWVDRAEVEAGALAKNSLVTVTGNFKTKVTEKDGRKFYTNVINAKTVAKPTRSGSAPAAVNPEWAIPAQSAEIPF
jgi:single-stranded DNA-binding protein